MKKLKKIKALNALLLFSLLYTLISCAKDKELETVYKTAELIQKNSFVSTDETYLYVPSTLQTPRTQNSAKAFFQGQEKLVKFKYTEKNLEIFELDSDSRFSNNELNSSPVISIPVVYKDYKCIENAQKECSQKEEENTELDWSHKRYVLPDYSGLKINEINILDLAVIDAKCANLTNTKLVNYEVNNNTLNIELERTYQTSSDESCMSVLFENDQLSNASFNVRYFYSFVKLSSVASSDFQPFVYDKEDERTFGFFKTEIKKLNKYFDYSRIEKQYLANHWNPNKKSIDFYLDPKFYKEENKLLLNATVESFQKINESLKQAGATIQINIAGKAISSSGDLRYNIINLLDEPQEIRLMGYAPTVSNPLTGEIVKTHVNMYSSTIIQTIRGTYQSMVDLGVTNKIKLNIIEGIEADEKSLSQRIQNYSETKNLINSNPLAMNINFTKTKKIDSALDKKLKKLPNPKLNTHSFRKTNNSFNSEEQKNSHKMCETDLINFAKVTKQELPNIRNIPGVVSKENKLTSWDLLTDEARQAVVNLILPRIYSQTLVHEIGHTLGLRHNFIGSFDKNNFYTDAESKALGLHTIPAYSSIMDYANSDLNSLGIMGKYDIAALRYMYAKKVETHDGQLIDIKTSIKDLDKISLKQYLFCTDENAGLSSTCNSDDEGSTLKEIAISLTEAYETSYKYGYYRNGKTKFDIREDDERFETRRSQFIRARQIFENYELLSSAYGPEIMEYGCPPEDVAKYSSCIHINDVRESALIIARMFLDIIKTPDLVCYVENMKGEKINTKELINLSDVFENQLKYTMDHTPVGCFDPEVLTYFSNADQKVLAQGGKFLNSLQEVNPKYAEYSSDIAIRGNFHDKLLAIEFLVTRYLGINGKEDIQGSMMDIISVADELNNYFAHIILGEKLINPVKFVDQNGVKINVEYSLSNNSIIPEPTSEKISKYYNFPKNSNIEFNRLAIMTAKKFSKSNDVEYRATAKSFNDALSVVKNNKFNIGLVSNNVNDLSTTKIDNNYYSAASENVFAKIMIDSINSELFLISVNPNIIKKILDLKSYKFSLPADYSEAQLAAASLPEYISLSLIQLKEKNTALDYDFLMDLYGQAVAQLIMKAYELNAREMQDVLRYVIEKSSLGIGATAEEKKIYSIEKTHLENFLDGTIYEKNSFYKKSLDIITPIL